VTYLAVSGRTPADFERHSTYERPGFKSPDSPRSLWSLRKKLAQNIAKSRLEPDCARGYSINAKQVVLAFAVEFVIIGLILVSQFVLCG
jgi:hypothetical protein